MSTNFVNIVDNGFLPLQLNMKSWNKVFIENNLACINNIMSTICANLMAMAFC